MKSGHEISPLFPPIWDYLVAVLDLKNREVIGYEVSNKIDSKLRKSALANALELRGKGNRACLSQRPKQVNTVDAHTSIYLFKIDSKGSMSAPGCPCDIHVWIFFLYTQKNAQIERIHLQLHRKYATINRDGSVPLHRNFH